MAFTLRLCALCALFGYHAAPSRATVEYTFSHVAGAPGGIGSTDGTSNARFNGPQGLAVDTTGNLYVADIYSRTIRRISAAGVVSTLAGTAGTLGSTVDGVGAAARFVSPIGVAVDHAGNVFVSDEAACVIRKILPDGTVSTLTGAASLGGYVDGTLAEARFYNPRELAIDPAGNIFVAETYVIRKITPSGQVSTFAGKVGEYGSADGTGSAARFRFPDGIATDSSGNVYVVDRGNNTVRKIFPGGVVITLAGTPGEVGSTDGNGSSARFSSLRGITVDQAGNVYVSGDDNTLRKITPTGAVTTVAGSAGAFGYLDASGTSARLSNTYGLAAATDGTVFIADTTNQVIRAVSPAGVVSTFAGAPASEGAEDGIGTLARIASPSGIVQNSRGDLFVAESGNHTIRRIATSGAVSTFVGSAARASSVDGIGTSAGFSILGGLTIDVSDNIYALEAISRTIRKITPSATVTTLAAPFTGGLPALNAAGNFYFSTNYTLQKITPSGEITTIAGTPGQPGSVDGTTETARLSSPGFIVVSESGVIYFTDGFAIRKVGLDKSVATVAGSTNESGIADGKGTEARFSGFRGFAANVQGTLFVTSEHTIRSIASDGTTRTIGGNALPGSGDGVGTAAQFYDPAGIAVAPDGTLYIADLSNNAVRKGVPSEPTSFAPTITSASSTSFFVGQSGSFTVTATGYPRPVLSAEDLPAWASFDVTSGILSGTPPNTTGSPYAVRFTAANGITPAALQNFTLTALPPNEAPSFSRSPTSIESITGEQVGFVAVVRGVPAPTLQWQVSEDSGATWTNLVNDTSYSGVTSDSLKMSAVTLAMNDYRFRCVATNPIGSTTSGQATLTVVYQSSAGTYFGTFANNHGQWALKVKSDNTAIYLAYLTSRHTAIIAHLTLNANGSFTATGTETVPLSTDGTSHTLSLAFISSAHPLVTANTFTLSGQVTAGTVTGQLTGLGETFSGSIDSTAGSAASGYYSASALNTASGATYAIVAPSGQALVVAVTSTSVDGATGTVVDNGQLTATTASGGQLAVTLNASAQSIAATLTPAGSTTPISFAGLSDTTASTARLVNIATRAFCGTDNKVTIGGFVVSGSANKRVLVRAVGPSLTAQGIGASEVLLDPTIEVHDAIHGNSIVATNDNLSDNPNAAELPLVAATVGASALLATDTTSAALLTTLPTGVYTFVVNGKNSGSGIVLLEVYDADPATPTAHFTNIASRAYATTGNGVAIGGFVISGNAPKRALLRAVGPTLTSQSLTSGQILQNPVIELHHGSDPVITNDNWGANATDIRTTAARIGATPLDTNDGTSAALLVTLSPGVYSFIAQGVGGSSGIVLVEVYDAD